MAVLHLVKYNARETIEVLRTLLAMAIRGEIRGVALSFRKADGTEDSVFTGSYKTNPGNAMHASLRLSLSLMQANGELE